MLGLLCTRDTILVDLMQVPHPWGLATMTVTWLFSRVLHMVKLQHLFLFFSLEHPLALISLDRARRARDPTTELLPADRQVPARKPHWPSPSQLSTVAPPVMGLCTHAHLPTRGKHVCTYRAQCPLHTRTYDAWRKQ